MKRKLSLFLTILLLIIQIPVVRATSFENEDKVKALMVADLESEKIFYEKNKDQALPIASITKIMTYLIARDKIEEKTLSFDTVIEPSDKALELNKAGYSRMNLSKGDKVTVKEIFEWIFVASANDGAYAIAEKIGGSEQEFVKLMNKKSEELGLSAKFVNSTGITEIVKNGDKEELKFNTMSAMDVFKLTKHIINKYPEVKEYGKISEISSVERNYSQSSTLPNRDIQSMTGLKTGTEDNAGSNVVSLFDMRIEKESQEYDLVTIVLGAENQNIRNDINRDLYNFVNSKYIYSKELDSSKYIADIWDANTLQKKILLYPQNDFAFLTEKTKLLDIRYKINENLKAPYEDGQVMGEVSIFDNGKEINKTNLINKGYVPKLSFFSKIIESLKEFFDSLLLLF